MTRPNITERDIADAVVARWFMPAKGWAVLPNADIQASRVPLLERAV